MYLHFYLLIMSKVMTNFTSMQTRDSGFPSMVTPVNKNNEVLLLVRYEMKIDILHKKVTSIKIWMFLQIPNLAELFESFPTKPIQEKVKEKTKGNTTKVVLILPF
jgi:hypothetical protein